MVHRPKIITLNQQIQHDYHVKTSGAASKILARLTKQLFGKAIKDKDLTPAQRSDVLGLIITDSMERDKKLFDAPTSKTESELNITQLDSSIETSNELNITHASNDAPPVESKGELNIAQVSNDTKQVIELNITQLDNNTKAPNELNITQDKNTRKFVTINFRRDKVRHSLQIERFYIDALKAIGIDDITEFVANNAGVAVPKINTHAENVKRAIINELVKRATK